MNKLIYNFEARTNIGEEIKKKTQGNKCDLF